VRLLSPLPTADQHHDGSHHDTEDQDTDCDLADSIGYHPVSQGSRAVNNHAECIGDTRTGLADVSRGIDRGVICRTCRRDKER